MSRREVCRWLVCAVAAVFLAALAACGASPTAGWGSTFTDASATVPQDGGLSNDAPLFNEASASDVPSLDLTSETYGPMQYLGGPILTDTVDIYFLWYGSWAQGSNRQALLQRFIGELSGSQWLGIEWNMRTYPWDGGVSTSPAGRLRVAGNVSVPYLPPDDSGTSEDLTDDRIRQVITDALSSDVAPYASNAVYVVVASNDVTLQGYNACDFVCAYHDSFIATDGGTPVRYAFLPDYEPLPPPFDGGVTNYTCQTYCTIASYSQALGAYYAPHGPDWAGDGMANALAHEIAEAIDDPDPSLNPAWQDVVNGGAESADKCEWRFDPAVLLSTYDGGAFANVELVPGDWWLLQQNWFNEVTGPWGGECVLAPPTP